MVLLFHRFNRPLSKPTARPNFVPVMLKVRLVPLRFSAQSWAARYSFERGLILFRPSKICHIQWMRLKRAAYRLAFNPSEKIIDIALDAGFQNPESFSRAFKQAFGATPSQFRKQPDWVAWHQRIPELKRIRTQTMQVKIVDFPETRVAMLTHRGQPERLNETVARFIEWRKTTGLSPRATSRTYGIAPHDPATTQAADFRFDVCGSIEVPVQPDNPFGVTNGTIPGGRCAVVRHHGSHDALTDSARYLYRDWLPASGEELRDFPLYFQWLNFVHEVAVHELLTDIYLPLR